MSGPTAHKSHYCTRLLLQSKELHLSHKHSEGGVISEAYLYLRNIVAALC